MKNSSHTIKSIHFVAAVLFALYANLCSFAVQDQSYNADRAYGDIEAHPVLDDAGNPTGSTAKTTVLSTGEGELTAFLSCSEGAAFYSDYACTEMIGTARFLEEFYEVWRSSDIALLANSDTPIYDPEDPAGGHATKIVGYVKRIDFISTKSSKPAYWCMRTTSNIALKALSVHKWEDNVASDRAQLLNAPNESAAVIDEINLYDINYVYATHGVGTEAKDGYYLIGRTPFITRDSSEVKNMRGWVTERRIFNWDHRQCLEINKTEAATNWRNQNNYRVEFYGSVGEAKSRQDALYSEDLDTGPLPYHTPRFPIIFEEGSGVDEGVWKVGVIGDSYSGDRQLSSTMESDLQRLLEEIQEEISNVDVLLVIDATGSMNEFYNSIGTSIDQIQTGFERANIEARYAVSYYRDYTEEQDPISWSHYYRDFLPAGQFRNLFDSSSSEFISSYGGEMDPCTFAGIINGCNSVSWNPDSTRVVILIGDQGNTRAQTTGSISFERNASSSDADIQALMKEDPRGNTLAETKRAMDLFNISMFLAIQTQPDYVAADPAMFNNSPNPQIDKYILWRYKEFNLQARSIQQSLNNEDIIDIISGRGTDLTAQIENAAGASVYGVKAIRDMLQLVQEGKPLNEAMLKSLADLGVVNTGGKTSANYSGSAWGVYITDEAVKRAEEKGIDVDLLLQERIQNFAFAYTEIQVDGCDYPQTLTRVLMTQSEVESLLAALGIVERQTMTASNVDRIWRGVINAAIGETEHAFTFDETKPLSEYFSQSLGIPSRSKYLSQSIRSLKTLEPQEIADWNTEIKDKIQKLRNFITNKKLDGTGTEKHVFIRNGVDYAYVPIELLP